MTDSFVTQCPHCRTSFRINRAQLGAAHGAVRCGACMHVFNAAQQLLVDQTRASKPPAAQPSAPARPAAAAPSPAAAPSMPPASKPVPERAPAPTTSLNKPATADKQPVDTLWIHDDLDLDSLDLDEELAKLEEQEMQLSQAFVALKPAAGNSAELLKAPSVARDPHDEDWAESLLREDKPAKPQPAFRPLAAEPQPPTEPTPAPAAPEERQEPSLHALRDEPNDNFDADEDPIEEVVDTDYALPANQTGKPERSEPALRDDSLLSLEDEPLQLDWQQVKKPWGRWIAWGLLNLLAAGALTTQYVAYHFEELARQDRYRPWFEQLCPEIGCVLPSKVDIEQIKSSNLVVRSHPEFRDSLVVDAIIYNRAPFAQPFPLLELRFADLNGQLLASRRFKPGEYLGGELAGQAEMPPQTPIHVSLEILDPGAKAVNYSLSFHSPE
ncbi:DUF3426 domain-containing protein [Aquipseudomonas guryensis]|jgi:predicted Zn finger-like uncharacterized protein|uniref:DUF3426 domain-containing protein n=1 Tax=Aquipseudomonas guryensis TaxID=2759165 RepID=A0A7W4DCX4_9GAMM|nr:DUF3426 domain-containing protein [Pseudomonas guryensis]MBB1520221.1 DUF3426 domain-containing protein [Pseudomonas guryensis]